MDTMPLKDFLASLPSETERAAFAEACGTSLGHIRNTFYDPKKRLAAEVIAAIERESGGAVLAESVRDDLVWVRIPDKTWPWHKRGRPVLDVSKVAA